MTNIIVDRAKRTVQLTCNCGERHVVSWELLRRDMRSQALAELERPIAETRVLASAWPNEDDDGDPG